MEDKHTLAKILKGDLADHIIIDGRKVLMNQVSGTLRRALMSKRQSIRLKAKSLRGIGELWNNLEVFTNSYNIVHLNLTNVIIGNEDCEQLSAYILRCPFLVRLDVRGTLSEFERHRIRAEGAGRLAAALGQCASLAYLDLSVNNIGDEGAESLATVLGQCASLAHLDLGRNRIGDEGAGRLAAVLRQCASLAHLDLSGNSIGAEAQEMFITLQQHCTVQF